MIEAHGARRKKLLAQRAKHDQRKKNERSTRLAARRQRKKQRAKAKRAGREEPRQVQAPSTEEQKRNHARRVVRVLRQEYGEAQCGLRHDSAFQLLIAAILAHENPDPRVNRVTRPFFSRYPDAPSVAAADTAELQRALHSTRCPLRSARVIEGACGSLVAHYGGEVPDTMSAIQSLGLERETANVVLRTWFGKTERVVVDAHGLRVALRLGLAPRYESPDRKERRLTRLVPGGDWADFGYGLTRHGRKVCHAQNPKCRACALRDTCPSVGPNGRLMKAEDKGDGPPRHRGPSKSSRWTRFKRWWPYRI